MAITIAGRHLAFLARAAEQAYPRESCAVLLGRGANEVNVAVKCANVHADSLRHYAMDPKELIRVQRLARNFGLQIVGFHHSHPEHRAEPSETDLAEANWANCVYLITEVRSGRAGATGAFRLKECAVGQRFELCQLLMADQGL